MSLRDIEDLINRGGKTLVVFLILSILGTIISAGVHFMYYSDQSGYVEVVATVIDTDRKTSVSVFSDDSDRRERFYATYEYEYNGVTYQQEARMSSLTSEIPGTETTILIDPDHPSRIDNGYGARSAILFIIVFAGLTVFLSGILIYQKINARRMY